MLGHRKPSSNKACCTVAVISSVQYVTLLCLQGYSRILKDLKQTQDRRHVLNQYHLKIKEVLQETQAICPEEKADFLDGAKECIEDLENNKYTVLIAGKTLNYRYSVLQYRLGLPRLAHDSIGPPCFHSCDTHRYLQRKARMICSNSRISSCW